MRTCFVAIITAFLLCSSFALGFAETPTPAHARGKKIAGALMIALSAGLVLAVPISYAALSRNDDAKAHKQPLAKASDDTSARSSTEKRP